MTTRNITTLSLITAAIIGLNGCGEDASSPKTSDESISSIGKLSEASNKHSDTDWKVLTGQITDLDKPEKFNTMLEGSIEKNVALLTNVGIDKEEAYAINSDMMYDDLVELDIERLDEEVTTECQENEICKEEAYASLQVDLTIDKEEAYEMSVIYREDIGKPSTMDGLLKEFTCATGLVRKVQFYGVEDNFSTTNGDENATASNQIRNNPSMVAYNNNVNADFANYDGSTVNRLFGEEVKNLPTSIANGHFYIGMANHGRNDTITLGNLDQNSSTDDLITQTITSNNAGLLKTGSVYHEELSNISLADGNTLKDYAYTHSGFDVYVQDDTFVDFIAVATCSKPNPIKEVTAIVNDFGCNEKQGNILKIAGGVIDNFSPTGDASNPADPSSVLTALNNYPQTGYDATQYDRHFIDTLSLGLYSGQVVTKAELNIGYKVIGSSLSGNDAVYVGDLGTNHAGDHLYDGTTSMDQKWNVHNLTQNYGYVATVNLFDLNNTTGTGNAGDTMIAKNELDIYVQDDTAVDFTQLNLCVKEKKCDESAKDYKIDLSQLNSWTNRPSDAQENASNNSSAWASDMNWIKFDNNGTDRILEIPFCACGNTITNIEHLKGDNRAKVELGTFVVEQPGNTGGITAFSADSAGGNHVDGTTTITGTGVGVNHTLRLSVHNFKSSAGNDTPFGVAIAGTLIFKGNLGRCKVIESTPVEVQNTDK